MSLAAKQTVNVPLIVIYLNYILHKITSHRFTDISD